MVGTVRHMADGLADPVDVAWARAMRRRGLAPATVEKRRGEFRSFRAAVGDWRAATRADVESWIDGRPLGARARYAAISHLHCFYVWARRDGLVAHDPTADVERPRLPRRLRRPALDVDIQRAMGDGAPARLRLAILLMALAGLRCCEVASITWADVELGERRLWVRGKGDHERAVGIPPQLAQALAADDAPGAERVVPWAPSYVSQQVNARLRAVGSRFTAHQIRHRFAYEYLAAPGGRVERLQHVLGHASIATTQQYTHLDADVVLAVSAHITI
jgi:site-specific recombinase XerC